jgi:hypothetical protein
MATFGMILLECQQLSLVRPRGTGNDLGEVAEIFKLMMQGEYIEEAVNVLGLTVKGCKDLRSKIGKLKTSIDKILVRVNGSYCVFDKMNEDGSPKCAITDPLTVQVYIDAWTRINGMNHPDRSGDIVLIMKDSAGGLASDRYTTGYACKAWHGSMNSSDSYVPFIFSYPGGHNADLEKILQKDIVCNADYSNCNRNRIMPDIIKAIISEQYK